MTEAADVGVRAKRQRNAEERQSAFEGYRYLLLCSDRQSRRDFALQTLIKEACEYLQMVYDDFDSEGIWFCEKDHIIAGIELQEGDLVVCLYCARPEVLSQHELLSLCAEEDVDTLRACLFVKMDWTAEGTMDAPLSVLGMKTIVDAMAYASSSGAGCMEQLFHRCMLEDAATRFLMHKFFEQQGEYEKALALVVSAFAENYSRAVSFMDKVAKGG